MSTSQRAKTPPTHAPVNGLEVTSEKSDARFLKYVREQSPRIVTQLSFAASQYGLAGRTSDMQDAMQIANNISTLAAHWPETQSAASPPALRAMAAGAG